MSPTLDARAAFIDLAEQVIDCLRLPRSPVPAIDGDALDVGLRIDGEQVTLSHEPDISPGHFLMSAPTGDLEGQADAARRLLVENAALLEHGWLTAGSQPGIGEPSYFALLEVTAAQPDGVADCARALVRRARLRRQAFPGNPSSTFPAESAPRPATLASSHDRRAEFDDRVRALCEALAVEPGTRTAVSPGRRNVTLTIDGRPVLLTHRTAVDSFCTARGVGNVLPTDGAERVAHRLLHTNREFAHEGSVAFALTADFRHVIWRVTSRLPGAAIDEFIAQIRWATRTADCADSDRPPASGMLHMLA